MVDPYPVGKINFCKIYFECVHCYFWKCQYVRLLFSYDLCEVEILYTTNNNRQTMSGQQCYQWKCKDVLPFSVEKKFNAIYVAFDIFPVHFKAIFLVPYT